MHLSTIIIGDEVKSRPRFTNCQTFNIRLTDKCLFNSPEVRFEETRGRSPRTPFLDNFRVADDSGVEGQLVVQSPCLPRKWYHLQSPSSTSQK